MAVDRLEEHPASKGLRDQVINARFGGAPGEKIIMEARNHDGAPGPTKCSEVAQDRKTIDVRHAIIDNHAVGSLGMRISEKRAAAYIAADAIAMGSEEKLQAAPDARIVVRDEDGVALIA